MAARINRLNFIYQASFFLIDHMDRIVALRSPVLCASGGQGPMVYDKLDVPREYYSPFRRWTCEYE